VGRNAIVAVLAALVVVTAIVYAPTAGYDYVGLDDPLYVSENANVAQGLTSSSIAWAFSTLTGGYWIPLTWLSYMLDVQIGGGTAGFHHVVNVILHIAATLALFACLRRATGSAGRSVVVAGLFALHPIHVESVAWITERKDVLSAVFCVLGLWAYVASRPAAGSRAQPGANRLLGHVGVPALFALSLMAKPMVIAFPLLLLLFDIWPLDRLRRATEPGAWKGLIKEKVPLFALGAAASVVTFIAQRQVGAVADSDALPIAVRAGNAVVSCVGYIGKLLWPVNLAPFYGLPHPEPAGAVIACALAVVAMTVLSLRLVRRRPYLAVGWMWYLLTLLPVAGLVQVGLQSTADRFTYVPSIGLSIAVVWGVAELLVLLPGADWAIGGLAAAALAMAACAVATYAQVPYWKDAATLWTRATQVTLGVDAYTAHMTLGRMLAPDGARANEAIAHFSEAVRLRPGSGEAQYELGVGLARQGRLEEAVTPLREAARLNPGSEAAHLSVGVALARTGRIQEAAGHLAEVLRLNPGNQVARRALDDLAGQGPTVRFGK
jgi:hypothetical protein